MRRALLTALLLCLPASPALGDVSGGAPAPGRTIPTAKAGGLAVGSGAAPVARLSLRLQGGRPRIAVRIDERVVTSVVARVVVLRGSRVVARIGLGRVRTGRTVLVPWRRGALPAGRYVIRVHARDRWANQLRRSRRSPGKATFVVRAPPRPVVRPAPPVVSSGVFPVAGPHTYGDGIGADRGNRLHQGQDLSAARGTPVVAPVSGTVAVTSYQAGGAGEYVVLSGNDGRSYFFAHCIRHSTPVSVGQAVAAGTRLCSVGSTGSSTGPHLHFEIWVGGWRANSKSRPIDPLPQLRAWDRG